MLPGTHFYAGTDPGLVLSHKAMYNTLFDVVPISVCNKTDTELMDRACCLLMKLLFMSLTAFAKLRNLAAAKLHNQP
jgi:hypothetical protein